MIRISIHDNGPGIPQSDQEEVFKPFFTTKAGGTGLGLAIARKLVLLHNGTMELVSTVNVGTIIDLFFPTHYDPDQTARFKKPVY